MTQPNLRTFVFGNILTRIFLSLVSAGMALSLYYGQAPGLIVIWIWVMTGYAFKCASEVTRYRARKAEWDAINAPVTSSPASNVPKSRAVLWTIGLVLWGFFGLGALGALQQFGAEPLVVFALASAGLVTWQLVRWSRRRRQALGPRIETVTINASASPRSPTASDTAAVLPEHVQALFTPPAQREV
jgi:hypothetical protein